MIIMNSNVLKSTELILIIIKQKYYKIKINPFYCKMINQHKILVLYVNH